MIPESGKGKSDLFQIQQDMSQHRKAHLKSRLFIIMQIWNLWHDIRATREWEGMRDLVQKKSLEKYHQFVVCWIGEESGTDWYTTPKCWTVLSVDWLESSVWIVNCAGLDQSASFFWVCNVCLWKTYKKCNLANIQQNVRSFGWHAQDAVLPGPFLSSVEIQFGVWTAKALTRPAYMLDFC